MDECTKIGRLQRHIAPLRTSLLEHSVYRRIGSLAALQVFMEHHVFAVWDFMVLLKALQRQLTCMDLLWRPNQDASAARFVNEIVLAEETDEDGLGGYCSHFELYLRAMKQCGAETRAVERFLEAARRDDPVAALVEARAPATVQRFVECTLEIVAANDLPAIASAFTFGREDLLPDVFERVVAAINVEADGRLDAFQYYLQRHIELDGDHHGGLAQRLVTLLCGESELTWDAARQAATKSLQSRLELWDGVVQQIEALPLCPEAPLAL